MFSNSISLIFFWIIKPTVSKYDLNSEAVIFMSLRTETASSVKLGDKGHPACKPFPITACRFR